MPENAELHMAGQNFFTAGLTGIKTAFMRLSSPALKEQCPILCCVNRDNEKLIILNLHFIVTITIKESGFKGIIGIGYEGNRLSAEEGINATKALLIKTGKAIQ